MLVEDKEEVIGHTRVQHGKLNDRVYVMDYRHALDPYLINQIQLLAKDRDYGKIIAKIPRKAKAKFQRNGFEIEAVVPGFYNGKRPCLFVSKYNRKERKERANKRAVKKVLKKIDNTKKQENEMIENQYHIRVLAEEDVKDMVHIYKKVFETYPFPIHEEDFIRKAMEGDTKYFGAFDQEQLVGLSSCEINSNDENVEMTDFAVLPEYRGKKIAKQLLIKMEEAMRDMDMKVAYTIARGISLPMNATFKGCGYLYGGTLWSNTHISGKLESMNVWYKML